MDGLIDEQMDRCVGSSVFGWVVWRWWMDRQKDGWMVDGWVGGLLGGWMDGWTDGWMIRCTDGYVAAWVFAYG